MNCSKTFFAYSWFVDDDVEEMTVIRIYGIDKNNKSVCVRVDDFTPYVYIELPENVNWDSSKAQLFANTLDSLTGYQRPILKSLCYKKKLYGAHIDREGNRKKYPYLFCSFSSRKDIRSLDFKLRSKINIPGIGTFKFKIHESDADPILQLTCSRKLPCTGWIKLSGKKQLDENKTTLCDHEYVARWKYLSPVTDLEYIPKAKIMGFDIEVNSSNPSAFPNAKKPGDKIFQISCVLSYTGDKPDKYEKYLLTLGSPDEDVLGEDIITKEFTSEAKLLEGFSELIRTENPNIIVGYNILGFDIPYMIERAKLCMCIFDFDRQGFHKFSHSKEKIIKWSSSAYGDQEFEFLDAEGRLYVDLLPLIKRDHKLNSYSLKVVSTHFLGETKDPLTAKGIFKCYRMGMKKNKKGEFIKSAKKAMALVGKYCVQDSALVVSLMEHLQTWTGLSELSKTCCVPIFTLYTQGQQIKVYSQIYKYCMYNNIVVEKDGYDVKEGERYAGAFVFPPVPGKYKNVVPFDFASLYPTTIIAYNIDYYTWVPDDSSIPNSRCHVMDWEDHIGCCHDPKVIRKLKLSTFIEKQRKIIKSLREKRNQTCDKLRKKEIMVDINDLLLDLKPYVSERSEISKTISKSPMCAKRKYRFLKEPKGVLPTVIQNLLDARKHTRQVDMQKCKDDIKVLEKDQDMAPEEKEKKIRDIKNLIGILNKRQLSFKISANSMYGAMGVRRGYLPFMPGAMCTTYMGRKNIKIVSEVIVEKYGGELIYGDTDSNYVTFPGKKSAQEIWDYALKVAGEISDLFPKPIELEFEKEIYAFFLIIGKKMYLYRKCLRDGLVDKKIGKKGVLTARRDNSGFVRNVYEGVINKIADDESEEDIMIWIMNEINSMFNKTKNIKDFVITKSVGDSGNLHPKPFINEKGEKKAKVGSYTTPLLSHDPVKMEKQLKLKKARNAEEFYLMSLPAQVQLAERMKKRGTRVGVGTRLEYLVTQPEKHKAKQYEKVESKDYFIEHKQCLDIDYFYYLLNLAIPLDKVLGITFKNNHIMKDFVLSQYNLRYKVHRPLLNSIKELYAPKIIFE